MRHIILKLTPQEANALLSIVDIVMSRHRNPSFSEIGSGETIRAAWRLFRKINGGLCEEWSARNRPMEGSK